MFFLQNLVFNLKNNLKVIFIKKYEQENNYKTLDELIKVIEDINKRIIICK